MYILLDLLLVLILALFAIHGLRRGFVKTVLSSVRLLIAVLLTYLFAPYVTDFVHEHFLNGSNSRLAELASDAMAVVVGYALTFLVAYLLLTLVIWLIGKVASLPVLKQCDKLLGLLLGLLSGVVVACLVATLLWALTYASGDLDIYEKTTLMKFFKELNIFKFVIETLL